MARWNMLLILPCAAFLTACATSSPQPLPAGPCPTPEPSVLVATHCPATLPALRDSSMGALAEALMDAAETYHACRRAALAGAQ